MIPQGYKHTELGIIPQEWKVMQLGNVLDKLSNGLTYDVSNSEGYPVTRIETISNGEIDYSKVGHISSLEGYERYKMCKGDILYSHINSLSQIGKVAYYNGNKELYHGMNLLLLRANNKVISEYLYDYLLTEQAKHIAQTIAKPAVNQASISTGDLRKIKILVPPIEEQRKIAEILGVWDKAIELQTRLVNRLELRKRALMQRLLSGRHRLPGFSDKWQKVKLGDVASLIKGEQYNKILLQDVGKYPVINGGIAPSGYTDKYNTEANTITISEGGNSCGYVNYIRTRFWSGGHCYTVRVKETVVPIYLYQLLKFHEPMIMQLRVGSGLPNIQIKPLQKYKLYIPSLTEQTAITEVLKTADKEIEIAKAKLAALRTQKRGLMQQLLTGKKRVKP